MYLRQLVPVYLYPEDTAYGIQGQVTPQMVRKQLEQTPDIRPLSLLPDIRRGRIGYQKHCGYRACIWDSADRG